MPPIDPRVVIAKRFPVHAAVDRCNGQQVRRLLEDDAEFHLARKIPDTEVSVLHTACSERRGPKEVIVDILTYIAKLPSCPLHSADASGQIPLHYAVCNSHAEELVSVLLAAGSLVDVPRDGDHWTPLHLAVAFGKVAVVRQLLAAGASPGEETQWGEDAQDLARRHKFWQISDILSSPRRYHQPNSQSLESDSFYVDLMKKLSDAAASEPNKTPVKLKEEEVQWRDAQGNSVLHILAWKGEVALVRIVLDSIKGRKLVQVQNEKGATPMALAMISGQDSIVEEFFQHKQAKKLLEFHSALSGSQQNVVHLMLQYCPFLPPKFLLKRKDLAKETLNAVDMDGNTPLLKCAQRNSRLTMHRVLVSKNVKDHELLDLGIVNRFGKSVLHYLVENKDYLNFAQLIDRKEMTPEAANKPDAKGRTPLVKMLQLGLTDMVRMIFRSEEACSKFDLNFLFEGQSILHLLAQDDSADAADLWLQAFQRPDVPLNAVDLDGNTALMKAVCCGRGSIVQATLAKASPEALHRVDLAIQNRDGNTLIGFCIQNMDGKIFNQLLERFDLRPFINIPNVDLCTPLLLSGKLCKWSIFQVLLTHPKLLKEETPDNDQDLEVEQKSAVDIHAENRDGHTALVLVIANRLKLARLEQTHNMKKERSLANEAKREHDALWPLVQLLVAVEKQVHGNSFVQGRDGGTACIKKQLEKHRMIRTPTPDAVISEFVKQYNRIMKRPAKQKSLQRADSKSEEQSLPGLVNGNNNKEPEEPAKAPALLLPEEALRNPKALQEALEKASSKVSKALDNIDPDRKKVEEESCKEKAEVEEPEVKKEAKAELSADTKDEKSSPAEASPPAEPAEKATAKKKKKKTVKKGSKKPATDKAQAEESNEAQEAAPKVNGEVNNKEWSPKEEEEAPERAAQESLKPIQDSSTEETHPEEPAKPAQDITTEDKTAQDAPKRCDEAEEVSISRDHSDADLLTPPSAPKRKKSPRRRLDHEEEPQEVLSSSSEPYQASNGLSEASLAGGESKIEQTWRRLNSFPGSNESSNGVGLGMDVFRNTRELLSSQKSKLSHVLSQALKVDSWTQTEAVQILPPNQPVTCSECGCSCASRKALEP